MIRKPLTDQCQTEMVTMTVALYERVSGSRQEKEETVETQDLYLRRHCDTKGHLIYGDPYRDLAVPNDTPLPARPAFQQLVADATLGRFRAVLCHTFDRWSRHYEVYYEGYKILRRLGIDLIPLDVALKFETPSDRFNARMMLGSKEYVMDEQLDLMWKGRHRIASTGGYPGGPVDYGYRLVPLSPKGAAFAIAPETAERVFEWYEEVGLNHVSCCEIARRLNRSGVPVPSACEDGGYRSRGNRGTTSGKWRGQMIALMLHKTVYKGYKMYGDTRIDVPPIVSEDLWKRAQMAMTLNKKTSKRNAQHDYLLSGKIWCVACERTLIGRMGILRKDGTQEIRYYCGGMQEQAAGIREGKCPIRSFYAAQLEADVWARLVVHLSQHEATLQRLIESSGSEEDHRQRLLKEQALLVGRKDQALRLRDCLAEGKNLQGWALQPEHAETLYHKTTAELAQIQTDSIEIQQQLAMVNEREAALKDTAAHLEYWHRHIRSDLGFPMRRAAVKQFIERVDAHSDDEGPYFKVWFRFDSRIEGIETSGRKGGDVLSIDASSSRRGCINYSFFERLPRSRAEARRLSRSPILSV